MATADISVIIPAASAPEAFSECLSSLLTGRTKPGEIIIIDDAMDEAALQIAKKFEVKVMKNPNRGVSSARNFGASIAKFPVILFIDTDIVTPPHAIDTIEMIFKTELEVAGAVGIQSKTLRYKNFFSKYKNHWMRYTYKRLRTDVHLFYTSFAAIRRNVFLESGGFDENYRFPSIEDTVLGAELGRRDKRIRIVPDVEVEHAKYYDFKHVLRTDFYRSSALIRFILRNWKRRTRGGIRKTSVPKRFMLSCMCMSFVVLAAAVAPFLGSHCIFAALIGFLAIPLLNLSWLFYLYEEEDLAFALKTCLFLPVDLMAVVFGIFKGFAGFIKGNQY